MDAPFLDFINRLGLSAESEGLSPIAGRLFARLLLAEVPLSLDDLADQLGVSKASVSTDARRLLERGVVERVAKPGDRRDYYELAADFFARTVEARVKGWRRMQALVADLRDRTADIPPVVARRFESIDDIETLIIAPLEHALEAWRAKTLEPLP